jgi:hypothetical protein
VTCFDTDVFISRRRDGALTPEERRELASHLAECPSCRRRAQGLDAAMGALGELPAAAPPAGLRDGVLARVASPPRLRFALVPLAAGLLIGFSTAYVLLVRPSDHGPGTTDHGLSDHGSRTTDHGRSDAVTLELRDHARRTDAFVRQAAALGDSDAPLLLAEYAVSDLGPRTRRLDPEEVPDDYADRILRPLAPVVAALDRGDAAALRDLRSVGADAAFRATLASYSGPAAPEEPAVPAVAGAELRDFLRAKAFYYAGRPGEALSAFESFRARHPGSALADDAMFWMARAAAETGSYERALPLYIEIAPGPWLDDAERERMRSLAGSLRSRLDSGAPLDVRLPPGLDLDEIVNAVLRGETPNLPAGTTTSVFQSVRMPLDADALAAFRAIAARHRGLTLRDLGGGDWEVTVAMSAVKRIREDAEVREAFAKVGKRFPFLFPSEKGR